MTMLIIGDLHLSDNPRDLYRDHFMRDLPAIVEKQQVRDVVVLGDLTEEKDRHSAQLTNMVVNHMWNLSRKGARVHIIPGNHDYVDEEQPFFEFLGLYPGISYYDKPTDVMMQGMSVMFLPHTHNHKRDWKGIDFDNFDVVFAHQTFKGAELGYNVIDKDGISLDVFGKGPIIISGDVHIPQRLNNLFYVGAPYTIDFGDDYEGRLLFWKKNGHVSVPVNCAQKRLITIAEKKDFDERIVRAGDVIKVRVMDDVFESFSECSEYVRKWANDNGCILHAFQMYQADVLIADEPRQRIETTKDDETILAEFATQRGINEKTLATGQRILRKT